MRQVLNQIKALGALLVAATTTVALAACTAAESPSDTQSSGASASQSSETSADPGALTLGLTYIPNVQFSPAYVLAENTAASHDLTVSLRHHGAEEGLFTALLSGEEDVVIASGDEVLQARQSGMDLVSIGRYYNTPPAVVIASDSSGITELSDLKGKTVGIPGEYGSSWYALHAILLSQNLSLSDITVKSIGYTQAAALSAGEVDAVIGFSNNDAVQIKTLLPQARIITPTTDELPLVSASIVTTQAWLDSNPETAKALLQALTESIQQIVNDPQLAITATLPYDPTLSESANAAVASSIVQATLPLWKEADGSVSLAQDLNEWERMADLLTQIPGILTASPEVQAAVSNDYLP